MASGTASSTAMWYFQINRSQSNGNQVYLFATNEITFSSGYTISLKKTTKGNADTLACIQSNPLYTLKGAVYEIHQGSATGTIVETLTTNASGEATGTKRYVAGTKLFAVEKTAPSGYLLNTTPVQLTVSTGSNVFNVADVPTFDPNRLVLNKTGTDDVRIQGAVFKVQFFASNWADSSKLLRTWYFASDASGFVYLREDHLASGYTSDAMFKQNGNVVIPLGCIQVAEVKAADGYLLPEGSDGKVFMFIRQGGTKAAQMGKPAGAYWGDGSANPINSNNPKGIYTMENDADLSSLTAVNEPSDVPIEIIKTSTDGAVSGISFKVEQYEPSGGIGWWEMGTYQTNTQGKITLEPLPIGTQLRITENVPENYICTSHNPQTITLTDGTNSVSFTNKPIVKLELVKTSDDGKITGIPFTLERKTGAGSYELIGTFVTDDRGRIAADDLIKDSVYRVTEIVPEGYASDASSQEFTAELGVNNVKLEWFRDQDCAQKITEWTLNDAEARYTVSYADGENDAEVMTIAMTKAGLNEINTATAVYGSDSIFSGYSECYVRITYAATVNSDATVVYGDDGNPNEVTLEWRRTNTAYYDTLKDCCHLYTYGIEVTKRFSDNAGQYAKVSFTIRNTTDGYWVKAEQAEDGLYYVTDHVAGEDEATSFVPNSESGVLTVWGLEDDAYSVTETHTADGYTLLRDSIEILITAEESDTLCEICGAALLTASATVNGNAVTMLENNGSVNAGVPFTVVNTKGPDLPKTGDAGTWMYGVIGAALAACSGMVLFLALRKRKTEQ